MSHPIIDQFLIPFIIRFFFVFGILCFAVGVGLIFNHVRMYRFFGIMNQWISMRRSTKWLSVPRDTGPVVQRFRRLIGAIFVLVATFSTFVLITQIEAKSVVAALRLDIPHALSMWLMESVRWLLITGSMVAIAVGMMLMFFPNTLLAIEARANYWYSTRSRSRGGDTMHMTFDRWIESYPRTMGWLIAAASLFVVVDFGIFLFARN